MNILVPIHSFEPGGVERVALRLAQAWQDRGHKVRVLLGRMEGATRQQAPELDYFGYPEPLPTARWETIWMIVSLIRSLHRERPDVIFCPGNTYTIVCVAAKLLAPRRCPPVLVKISNDLDPAYLPAAARPFYQLWLRIQGLLLDRFVAIAPPMRDHIAGALRVPRARVATILDPALTEEEFARLSKLTHDPSPAPHLVAVGRLVAQKNFVRLIEAFAAHAPADARLTIAGDGPQRSAIERAIVSQGISGRVTLPGHIADVPALLETADLLVLSSDYEGAPAVVLEALAVGLPIAATRCCVSMGWLLDEGRLGAIARCASVSSLGHAIGWALAMERRPDEARARAAQFVIGPSATAYIAAFQSLLEAAPISLQPSTEMDRTVDA